MLWSFSVSVSVQQGFGLGVAPTGGGVGVSAGCSLKMLKMGGRASLRKVTFAPLPPAATERW